jgi:hypothetical protein
VVVFLRTYLGAFNFAAGLNFFILVWPQPIPHDPLGAAFMTATLDLWLFQLAKLLECIAGFLLLTNVFTPFALILLFPITINIFVMDTFFSHLAHVKVSGARIFVFHLFLFAAYAQHFFGLLRMRVDPAPIWRTFRQVKDHL